MPRLRILVPLALAALLGTAAPADVSAQPRLAISGGIASPMSDFGNQADPGYHARVGLHFGIPLFPLSFRAEGELDRFSGASGGNVTVLGGSGSVVLALGGIGISPYVMAGMGKYRTDYSSEFGALGASTDTGYHVGFGVNVGLMGFGAYAEARVVNVSRASGDVRWIPLGVGFRF